MDVVALLLAAGDSERMGSSKALLPWRGQPLLAHQLQQIQRSGVAECAVVRGRDPDRLRPLVEARRRPGWRARAIHLRDLSERLGKSRGQEKWFQMSVVIEKTCKEMKNLNANVDFYAASTYYLLGFEMDLFTPIFACSRAPGWIAHVIEQHTDNRLIRPLEEYIGPPERPYVPLDKRG